jgi:hypothetical protein
MVEFLGVRSTEPGPHISKVRTCVDSYRFTERLRIGGRKGRERRCPPVTVKAGMHIPHSVFLRIGPVVACVLVAMRCVENQGILTTCQ